MKFIGYRFKNQEMSTSLREVRDTRDNVIMPISLILWHLNLEWKPHRDWLMANNVDLTPFEEEEEFQYFNLQIREYTKNKWNTK